MVSNVFRAFLSQKLEAGGSETTIYLDRITTLTGEEITTSDFSDFSRGILTINPKADGVTSFIENVSFTAVSGNTLTGVTRGLSAKSNSVVAANKRFHPAGTPVILSWGSHNIQDVLDYIDAEIAALTVGSDIVSIATCGENVAAGDFLYLKNDGKWWKTDADTAATIDGVQLGVAQGSGTADGAITNGVMTKGLDSNQSGLTAGTEYFISNTAGEISSSAGTNSKKVGVARSTTAIYVDFLYGELPTGAQKEALDANSELSAENPVATKANSFTAGETINGATTPVPVYQNTTDNEFYACDANDNTKYRFVGFAITNSTDGAAITVQMSGVVSGFTGLVEGSRYYVQDAVGTIGTSPGTQIIEVGVAVSETQLLITQKPVTVIGTIDTGTMSANSNNAVTTGFYPRKIRIKILAVEQSGGSATGIAIYEGIWYAGTLTSINALYNDGSSGYYANASAQIRSDASSWMDISITSVSETGFTITLTEEPSNSFADSIIMYEAES